MKKLRNNRGETLVEVMAAILISALSVALLFSCVTASFDMDKDAKELDKKHYEALTAAETRSGTAVDGTVIIVNSANSVKEDLTVEIYGGTGMYSYKRAG